MVTIQFKGCKYSTGDRVPGLLPGTWVRGDVRSQTEEKSWKSDPSLVRAVVEQIHPQGRLAVIRFEMPGGSFREAYVVRNGVMFP